MAKRTETSNSKPTQSKPTVQKSLTVRKEDIVLTSFPDRGRKPWLEKKLVIQSQQKTSL